MKQVKQRDYKLDSWIKNIFPKFRLFYVTLCSTTHFTVYHQGKNKQTNKTSCNSMILYTKSVLTALVELKPKTVNHKQTLTQYHLCHVLYSVDERGHSLHMFYTKTVSGITGHPTETMKESFVCIPVCVYL